MYKKIISVLAAIVIALVPNMVSPAADCSASVSAEINNPYIPVKSIKPQYPAKNSFTLAVKQSRVIKVKVYPSDASNKTIRFQSLNRDVAAVNKDGRVVGKKTGTATIVAVSDDIGKAVISYKVKVVKRKKGTHSSTKNMKTVKSDSAKYTYKQMVKDLDRLKAEYSEFLTYSSLGKTADKRNVYEVVIGNKKAKKQVVVQATMHAREYINSILVMQQIESICANYYTGTYNGKYYSEIFDKVGLHIVPMVNPDGVTISQYGADGIKNKKLKSKVKKMCKKYGKGKKSYYTKWKANARGVDLNRNYPLKWKSYRRSAPSSADYKGSCAGSEKETKMMMGLVERIKPKTVISYHSTGSIIYWNFRQKGKLQKQCKSIFETAKDLTGYKGAGVSSLGPCFGDWVCAKKKIPTITIETGKKQCPIKIKEYKSIWNKNKYILPAVSLWCIKN